MVAGPSDAEQRWQQVKKAGACAGAHWVAVGARAFNAPDVVGPAAERLAEKNADAAERTRQNAADFSSLHMAARDIFNETSPDFDLLGVAELKQLVSFVFKAKNETGITKHAASKATALAFIQSLPEGELEELLADPFKHRPANTMPFAVVLAVEETEPAADEPAAALLMPPVLATSPFDDLSVDLPGGLKPLLTPPPWLPAALGIGSKSGTDLLQKYILYRWPAAAGGWLLGRVSGVVDAEENEKIGGEPCNFTVFYDQDGEVAHHHLSAARYARNSKSRNDSWVLLG